jgi:hypothetical protein
MRPWIDRHRDSPTPADTSKASDAVRWAAIAASLASMASVMSTRRVGTRAVQVS